LLEESEKCKTQLKIALQNQIRKQSEKSDLLREEEDEEFQASPKSNNEDPFPRRDIWVNVDDDNVFESAYKGGETSFSEMTMNLAT